MTPDATDTGPGPVRATLAVLRRGAGRVRRALRSAVESRLHPLRRRRARKRLASTRAPEEVLFVCLGNVCRSPYAEARFRQRVHESGLSVRAGSAGLIGPGRPPPDAAVQLAGARGLDTSRHRSRLATRDLVAGADLLVVMESAQIRALPMPGDRTPHLVLGDLDPDRATRRSIRDPWAGDEEVYTDVFDRIDRCVDELVELLADGIHPGRPERGAGARAHSPGRG